jgi:hypothetical protein
MRGTVEADYYLPEELPDRQWIYFLLGKKFGWTPMEVDQIPAMDLDWILAIAHLAAEKEKEKDARSRGDDDPLGGDP